MPVSGRVVPPIDGVDALIAALAARGFDVLGPTVRDGAIVLDQVSAAADLPIGWTDVQDAGTYRLERRSDRALFGYAVGPDSARAVMTPRRDTLVRITRRDGSIVAEAPSRDGRRRAVIGLRGCDLAAVAVQDRVLRDGAVTDPGYAARRESTFVVGVNCSDPVSTCFCPSMGTGPGISGGHDLVVTELLDGEHRLLLEAGSDRGRDVLDAIDTRPATDADVRAAAVVVERSRERIERSLDPGEARIVLRDHLEHDRWDDVAERCLSCTNCTLVCPTCFCSAVEEHTSLDGAVAERRRRWDSCFSLDHSWLHGAGPVRHDTRARYRQWLTHKLSTWWDQFDSSGCVGCGRCITWCPVGIDLTEEVAAMAEAP